MNRPPLCPHCGAVLEIFYLAPGDKAARCRYCEMVVDLPETESTVTEQERIEPDGTRTMHRVHVSRSNAGPMPDLMGHVNQMLADVQGRAHGKQVENVRHERVEVSSQTTVEGDWDDMPPEAREMLAAMGVTLPNAQPPPTATPPGAVWVDWPDGSRYTGKLIEARADQALVEFSDGSRRWVPRSSIVER